MDQRAAGLQQQLRQASHTYGEIFKSAHVQLEHAKLELERCKGSLHCVTEEKKRAQEDWKQIHQEMLGLMQAAERTKSELEHCKGSLQRVTDEKKRLQEECKQIHDEMLGVMQAAGKTKFELERCKGSLQCVTDEKKRLQDESKQIHVDRQLLTQALIELQHENKTLRASASEQQLTRNRDSQAQVAELTRQLLAAQEALTVEAAAVGELEAATQRR